MAIDSMPGSELALDAPAHKWLLVTPNNSADLPGGVPKGIHLGGDSGDPASGTIVCRDGEGNDAEFFMNQGETLWIRPHRILATGTTADLVIVALY